VPLRTVRVKPSEGEHLDELNARAQAIRHQHGQLGRETLPVTGRPYALHPRDEVQIRRTIPHPEHGQLRNGTIAQIAAIDPDGHTVSLRLADGQTLSLDREQTTRADLRLAYVQHPFPAQGQTTDTAHLVIGEHATQEGSYVALTRAREQTRIHAAGLVDPASEGDRLQALSERMSRLEPDLPSIHTPLAHESAVTIELAGTGIDVPHNGVDAKLGAGRSAISVTTPGEVVSPPSTARGTPAPETGARIQLDRDLETSHELEPAADRAASDLLDGQFGRAWPPIRHRDLTALGLADDHPGHSHPKGWEP
jgi:hypothetical protein